jgi:DNA polymerase/3'-5' exonuclease PolX
MDFRQKIIDELTVLQKKEQQERNVFKARAYGKVVGQIKARTEPIRTLDDVKDIPGVGDKIRAKIEEIITTGSLEAARNIRNADGHALLNALLNIYGVGPVTAKELVSKYPNVQTIDDLRALVKEDPSILNEKQHIGLQYYEDLLERIPRKEMVLHQKLLHKALYKVKRNMHSDVVGSFRRGSADSGDIDVLIGYPEKMKEAEATAHFATLVQRLQESGYIQDVLALGSKKCMAICRLTPSSTARRLDLLLTNATEYPYALLYFTGSDKFNIEFRRHALERGYTLNEHALRPVRENIPAVPTFKTEADIFEFLQREYVAPEQRNQ